MVKVLPQPLPVRTAAGLVFARFAVVPRDAAEPWWLVYRGDCGRWFTVMADGA